MTDVPRFHFAEVSDEDRKLLLREARKDVFEQGVVCLTGIFTPVHMVDFRRALRDWAREEPVFPDGSSPGDVPNLSYHRRDDGKYPSTIPHVFHQFGLGNFEALPEPLQSMSKMIGNTMLEIQNELASTNFGFSFEECQLKILHYPSGAGFLANHVHPLEPQRVGLILAGSELGQEYESGGTVIESGERTVTVSDFHKTGDVVAFRYDLEHEVLPVDPESKLDWESESGKWSIVLDLRKTTRESSVL